jgi:hypothetical protein
VEVAVRERLRMQETEIEMKLVTVCGKIGEMGERVRELCRKKMSYAL